MNFYPFHLGDYAAHTKHLTLLEDLAYRRMIDLYYTNESQLPLDPEKVARLIGMRDHMREVSDVLSDFFVKSEGGYSNSRCDKEIAAYKAKADRAKSANKSRWSADKSDSPMKSDQISDVKSDADRIPTNNQEPITNNHKPLKTKAETQRATRLPADWMPSQEDVLFLLTERPDLAPDPVAFGFRDYWVGISGAKGKKLDWPATWRNWVRNQRVPQARASPAYQTPQEKQKSFADRLTGNSNDQRHTIIDI